MNGKTRQAATLEIITHCWAKHCEHYWRFLRLQLESIFQHHGDHTVLVTVFYASDDPRTKVVVDHFENIDSDAVSILPVALDHSRLFRRAIGRNLAALSCVSDVMWFTDCDYMIGEGTVDAMLSHCVSPDALYCPQTYKINATHEIGDALARESHRGIQAIDESMFEERRQKLAIGGLQIVPGAVARRGYLRDTKWTEPVDPSKGFRSCKCDRAYRGWLKTHWGIQTQRVEIPNIYRCRHSSDGRDFTEDGVKLEGKQAW